MFTFDGRTLTALSVIATASAPSAAAQATREPKQSPRGVAIASARLRRPARLGGARPSCPSRAPAIAARHRPAEPGRRIQGRPQTATQVSFLDRPSPDIPVSFLDRPQRPTPVWFLNSTKTAYPGLVPAIAEPGALFF
jgi:hypothetical protein